MTSHVQRTHPVEIACGEVWNSARFRVLRWRQREGGVVLRRALLSLVLCCLACNAITGSSELVVGNNEREANPQSADPTTPTTPTSPSSSTDLEEIVIDAAVGDAPVGAPTVDASSPNEPVVLDASIDCTSEDDCNLGSTCCALIGVRHARCLATTACAAPNLRLCRIALDCRDNEKCVERSREFNNHTYCSLK